VWSAGRIASEVFAVASEAQNESQELDMQGSTKTASMSTGLRLTGKK